MQALAASRFHSVWREHRTRVVLIAVAICSLVAAGLFIGFNQQPTTRATSPADATSASRSSRLRTVTATPTGLIAALVGKTAAFRSPGGPAATPIAPTWYGAPLFLPIIATRAGDLEVRLPTRPNGSTTWVRSSAVRLYHSPYRIVVNLRTRHLQLYRDDKLVLNVPAGVGTNSDPTPTGQFFVAFFAKAPSAAWGPFVLVTSAHSNAISDWEESGDAIVAIHGPLGEGAAIGTAGAQISHGCVRLHDVDLARLRGVPDGSPVDIID